MKAGKIILFVLAGIFLIFGVIFILSAFGPGGRPSSIWIGIGLVVIGLILIFFGTRAGKTAAGEQNVTVNIDLPGEVGMDTLKCKSCGGVLSAKDVKLVNGAPMVTCPYCGTTYQLTEEPKW